MKGTASGQNFTCIIKDERIHNTESRNELNL
jgi:hypothetical protein